MTRAVYLVDPAVLAGAGPGTPVTLDGPEGRHAATVRRTRVGERVDLVDGEGTRARACVVAVGTGTLDLRVESAVTEPEPSPRFVLVQALAKGDRDERAVEAATECGVDEVVPWQAARCVVQWRGDRGERSWRRWDAVLVAATKQSRRARRPVLGPTASTEDLVARSAAAAATLVLHEDADAPLATVDLPPGGDVLVVVGPEGGIAPEELDALGAAGGTAVRLGPTVLRSSSAGPAALAVLSARDRWR
jgi:16S rRNA (uracil1498-N3)-methyltransferase